MTTPARRGIISRRAVAFELNNRGGAWHNSACALASKAAAGRASFELCNNNIAYNGDILHYLHPAKRMKIAGCWRTLSVNPAFVVRESPGESPAALFLPHGGIEPSETRVQHHIGTSCVGASVLGETPGSCVNLIAVATTMCGRMIVRIIATEAPMPKWRPACCFNMQLRALAPWHFDSAGVQRMRSMRGNERRR